MKTRHQQYLMDALEHVTTVQQKPRTVAKTYGGLCHQIPVLIRNHGLAQTCAWIDAKATESSSLGEAYRLQREHLAQTLGLTVQDLLTSVGDADIRQYMHYTYTVMEAWVYHKRFAVSMLKVSDAASATEEVA